MKLDEARDVLTDQASKGYHFPDQKRKEASKLGAEALAFLIRWRDKAEIQPYPLLPSETTD